MYDRTAAAGEPERRVARLTVLAGPTAVGKGTVAAAIRRDHPDVWISVSATTRRPRPGEIHGVHYWFVSDEEFDRMIAADELLEWAVVHGANRYGTPRGAVLDKLTEGRPALLEIDLQGARQVRQTMPEALFVFLSPPDWDELVRRLLGRGTESPEEQERRLETARMELAAEKEFDVTIVNTEVRAAADELVALMRSYPDSPEA
ncbi:guanylate kinase [Actinopolymorpha pittospori]|uniref:Guanylate kinase n=1 Tax=Actinopolymorpha pittospori TaxID=648752 RepID=A0A927N4W6_9ACTN|nr:guanylate kinase [Actinopolymorpha pittospori]